MYETSTCGYSGYYSIPVYYVLTKGSEKKTIKTTCLKCPRFVKCSLSSLPSDLSEEYEFVKERLKEDATVCHLIVCCYKPIITYASIYYMNGLLHFNLQ